MPRAKCIKRDSMPEPNSGCLLWLGYTMSNGYGLIRDSGRKMLTHRLAWENANGPIPEGMHVCHKCDVRSCVNPDHLFLGTHADNMADKVAKQRQNRGESHGTSKLTEAQVLAIRADSRSQSQVAADYGVSQTRISFIKLRKHWRHI